MKIVNTLKILRLHHDANEVFEFFDNIKQSSIGIFKSIMVKIFESEIRLAQYIGTNLIILR